MITPLVFLTSSTPLTKEYNLKPDGSIEKTNYPNVYEVTSLIEDCPDLKSVATALKRHAAQGHCLVKGLISRDLVNESRAGSTDPNAESHWMLFDLDGTNHKSPDEFMRDIGFPDVSYVVQYSASHHIYDKTLRCHIYVYLSKPCAAPLMKQYLIAWNFSVPSLKSMLTLTRTGTALRYGLDVTTCQNDKLIYISNPILNGVKDPFAGKPRISYVKRKHEHLVLPEPPSLVVNKAEVEAHIATLREAAKLPKRKNTYKHIHNTEVLSKPDQAVISGIKEDRGFVYFNLNGGDSWAYYHPANNPDFIHNFKGEPTYLTKELLPDYWSQVTQAAKNAAPTPVTPNAQGIIHLAFLDRRSSGYWRGTYNQNTDVLDIYAARNETQVRHYAAANDITIGEFIPEWDLSFDPMDNVRVDITNRSINMFQPTKYMLAAPAAKPVKAVPPTIAKILLHIVGGDIDCFNHLVNWIAYIAQFRSMTRTAWVLQGTEGTGKGLFFHQILRPLFGATQTMIRPMTALDEIYNSYLERSFIVMIDEVQTSTLRNEKGIMAKLRNFITEPMVSIRAMYQTAFETKNYSNWIFSSNQPDPVAIPKEDRRFNVGKYQPNKLQITEQEIHTDIPQELPAFYQYLMEYKVDEAKAHSPLLNEDRKELISISESSIDSVASAILDGNFEFLMQQLPTTQLQENLDRDIVEAYKMTLLHLINRTAEQPPHALGRCNISRDELFAIFQYTVGDMPRSPNKLTSRLKHHRIHIKAVKVDGITTQGISVLWHDHAKHAVFKAQLSGKPKLTLAKNGTKK